MPVRFSEEFRAAVDQAVEKHPRSMSRNDWILEACRQRLEREADQLGRVDPIVEAVESRAPDGPVERVPSLPLPSDFDPADPPVSMTYGGVTFVPDEWTAPVKPAPVAVELEPEPGVVLTVPDGRCSHRNTRSHALFGKVCDDCHAPKTAW